MIIQECEYDRLELDDKLFNVLVLLFHYTTEETYYWTIVCYYWKTPEQIIKTPLKDYYVYTFLHKCLENATIME